MHKPDPVRHNEVRDPNCHMNQVNLSNQFADFLTVARRV